VPHEVFKEKKMFKKILIANRGEIAVRIMRTCREMSIATVAVCSEVDTNALHAITADECVLLGPAEPLHSYLNIEKIIKAAIDTGAEAIHPGYGFLSENPLFARACQKNNIVFIGPPPEVIEKLGDKIIARRIMEKSGVPVTPGMTVHSEDHAAMAKAADQLGYPVMVKAAAGGGGKGMRVVNKSEELADSCDKAISEAKSAFGDGRIYLEKYLDRARHVEFQILCDSKGNAIHLLERECSIQRRHQKIIEETPSTALDPELRRRMGCAAVEAAKASGYVNAGTVEFMLDPDNRFYFLEVNTRLQVEHPVTEMTTGIDLVRHQIEIAYGQPLNLSQEDIVARGHAIECRIYAEDPQNNFFPSPGKIQFMQEPAGPGVRNDCGIYSGFEVPVEYDPILSKLVVHAENRDMAIKRMIRALQDYTIIGVKTPVGFLIDVLSSKPFQAGDTFTDFINTHFSGWTPAQTEKEFAIAAFLAHKQMPSGEKFIPISQTGTQLTSLWQTLGNWRL
jgi:acetyl-CoA carboxylase, biotin carboxylase subunit